MTTTAPRPVPVVDDVDTGGFFEAAARGVLAVRMCNGCDAVLHVPVAHCHRCGGWSGRWQPTSGTGRVHTWSVVAHQVHPAFPVPYTVVLVELDDHPEARFVGHLPGRPDIEPGLPMEVWFERVTDDVALPQWRVRT